MSKKLVITSGEPSGIGPDLILMLAQQTWQDELVVIADQRVLESRAKMLGLSCKFRSYQAGTEACPNKIGELTLLDMPTPATVKAGELNPKNGAYIVEMLKRAIDGCMNQEFAAMVTGPIHKGVINDAGIPFSGHTELLAEHSGTKRVVMMLATPGLRVALVTTHLPLSEVPKAITPELLTEILTITDHSLRSQFAISDPKILVTGLNPHAGEGGHMGREEIDIIEPALESLQKTMNLQGPLPADTLFTPKYLQEADAVVAMYHDQGLPVLKHMGFGNAVNITLGLPFIRTSVDHGTALDLAGSGKAESGSFRYAIEVAQEMLSGSQQENASA